MSRKLTDKLTEESFIDKLKNYDEGITAKLKGFKKAISEIEANTNR